MVSVYIMLFRLFCSVDYERTARHVARHLEGWVARLVQGFNKHNVRAERHCPPNLTRDVFEKQQNRFVFVLYSTLGASSEHPKISLEPFPKAVVPPNPPPPPPCVNRSANQLVYSYSVRLLGVTLLEDLQDTCMRS